MLKSHIIQIEPDQIGCLNSDAQSAARTIFIILRMRALLMLSTLILWPGNHAWAATGGLFLSATFLEICGSLLLTGLSLTALVFGLRMVIRSILVRPTR